MALFGEKCMRCGKKRTRKHVEGIPTCDACALELTARREHKRICPIDGSDMRKGAIQNVIVDRCPHCNGVWLDGGEIDLIGKAIQADKSGEFTRGFVWGMIIG